MTRDEFKNVVRRVRECYTKDDKPCKFLSDKGAFDTWYKYFEHIEYGDTINAVFEYAKENEYLPSIADLVKGSIKFKAERETLRLEINNYYDHIMSGYPGEKNGKEIFERLVFETDDTDKQIQMAAWITAECLRQVDRYESGEAEFVVLEEYLKSLEMEICRRRKQ